MASDIIDLGIGLDPTPFVRGAKEIETAADRISGKVIKTSQTTDRFNGSMRDVFKASSGSIQVIQGVDRLSDSLAKGAASATLMSSAFLALEIAKTADDFNDVNKALETSTTTMQVVARDAFGIATGFETVEVATKKNTSALGAFFGVLAANPLIAIVTGLSAISAVMSLIGDNAAESKTKVKSLADEFAENSWSGIVGGKFGGRFGDDAVRVRLAKERQDKIFQAALDAERGNEYLSPKDIVERSGFSGFKADELQRNLYDLWRLNGESTAIYQRTNNKVGISYPGSFGEFPPNYNPYENTINEGSFVPRIRARDATRYFGALSNEIPDAGLEGQVLKDEQDQKFREELANDEFQKRSEAFRRQVAEAEEAMARLRADGEAFGSSMSNAFFDIASGARSSRDAIRDMASEFLRMFAQKGFSQFGAEVFALAGGGAAQSGVSPYEPFRGSYNPDTYGPQQE